MKEAYENLLTRRSVRAYSDKPVPRETVAAIVEAGRYAPSGMGRQPCLFVAVQDPETVQLLSRLNAAVMGTDNDPFYGASTVVMVLADRTAPTYRDDGALAMGNLMNAAHALGVDSCWIHRAREVMDGPEGAKLREKWGISGDYEGIGHCILGYAAGEVPAARPRREGNVLWI